MNKRKLALKKITVRKLLPGALGRVAGGRSDNDTFCMQASCEGTCIWTCACGGGTELDCSNTCNSDCGNCCGSGWTGC